MGKPCKKPQNEVLASWDSFRWFVVRDWQGEDEIRTKKLVGSDKPEFKKVIGKKCDNPKCGGMMRKKQNRSDKSFFWGCTNWPKCSNTKPFLN